MHVWVEIRKLLIKELAIINVKAPESCFKVFERIFKVGFENCRDGEVVLCLRGTSCREEKGLNQGLSFYRLPADKKLQSKWL